MPILVHGILGISWELNRLLISFIETGISVANIVFDFCCSIRLEDTFSSSGDTQEVYKFGWFTNWLDDVRFGHSEQSTDICCVVLKVSISPKQS